MLGEAKPWVADFCLSVFQANFVDDLDIQAEETVEALLRRFSLDAEPLIEQARGDDAKEALRKRVDRARQLGIFGAPTFMVGNEMFWGNDRLEDAIDWALKK